MGFRSFRDFNEALLAKQGWRLITQPQSLIAQVLKAKYFPKCHLFEAKESNTASYSWKSIQKSLWILKKGCVWTVGDGSNINIWEDNWLMEQNGYKVWSKKPPDTTITKVQHLILDQNQWNQNLINKLFLPFEVDQIRNIPLTNIEQLDELIWNGTQDGHYSVRSGYHSIIDWKETINTKAGNSISDASPIWEKLWKIKVPPKQITCLWRILHDALPTKEKLFRRGAQHNPLCPRCCEAVEDINHIFMECEWSKRVWFDSNLTINFNRGPNSSFIEWIIQSIQHRPKQIIEEIASITYSIWFARNKLVFQEQNIPVNESLKKAMESLWDYSGKAALTKQTQTQNPSRECNNKSWSLPPKGTLKLNVDAHCLSDGRWGIGLLLRGDDGDCVGAFTTMVKGGEDVTMAEALGLREAQQTVNRLKLHNVAIEMDAKRVVDAILQKSYPKVYWGRVAKSCEDWFGKNQSVSLRWVSREANAAAH
jgi:ribonuclease HI